MDFSSLNPITSNSLNLAARNNDVKNVLKLLKKINPNCVDNRGWTCLHEAANSDSYESLELIVKHPDCRPLSQTHEGHTALYLACRNKCSIKTIKLLLETVKDIANISSTEGVTPLHVVSEQGRVELIQLLLDHGANIDVQDFDGDTPLHEACLTNKSEAMMVLLQAGANPLIRNERQFTPFHIACFKPCLKVISKLIHFVDDINQKTNTGDTPLMIALLSNCGDDIINFLLDNGADPNIKNNEDRLALDTALELGYSSIFKKLLTVTDHEVINVNILNRACKPHYFEFNILGALLTSDLGPKFFQFTEPCPEAVEGLQELQPIYLTHAPLNAFLRIADYINNVSDEKFKEYFYLFLMRGVSVNAVAATEFPPLTYMHYCNHINSFYKIFEILIQYGCNVDYCSVANKYPRITDAFVASLNLSPGSSIVMMPYSLYCDPGSLIEIAVNNGILERMPEHVQNQLIYKIDNCRMTVAEFRSCYVPSLKHISRLKVREIIKLKDGTLKTTQQFLEIVNSLPLPPMIKSYIRFC